jgi:hypothetical protein
MPINDEITIVRSGTSLMMKMLEAGGIEPVTENIRGADLDNPKGYYEFEKVKTVAEDSSWLPGTRGKAFKMMSIRLRNLPRNHRFKIIFMRREIGEILASQSKMLEHMGKASGPTNEQMATLFTNHLAEIETWLAQWPEIEVLYVSYNDLVQNPSAVVDRIKTFLNRPLNVDAMIATVDISLYRNEENSFSKRPLSNDADLVLVRQG